MTLMRIELVRVFLTEAPRFTETKKGDKLMTVTTIANPDPKALDKDGNPRYNSFRVSCTVNITNTPWKAKAQKGDPVYMSGDAMMRMWESNSDKATFGVGVELEIRYPTRFEILADLRERADVATDGGEKPAATRTRTRTRTRQPDPEPEVSELDDELPEGLDD